MKEIRKIKATFDYRSEISKEAMEFADKTVKEMMTKFNNDLMQQNYITDRIYDALIAIRSQEISIHKRVIVELKKSITILKINQDEGENNNK